MTFHKPVALFLKFCISSRSTCVAPEISFLLREICSIHDNYKRLLSPGMLDSSGELRKYANVKKKSNDH